MRMKENRLALLVGATLWGTTYHISGHGMPLPSGIGNSSIPLESCPIHMQRVRIKNTPSIMEVCGRSSYS